jgi:hypothetical protein
MHQPIPVQGSWLGRAVTGHFAYYAVPTNARALSAFRHYVTDLWRRTLQRHSQKDGLTGDRMTKLADHWFPAPRILHPWPDQRFWRIYRSDSLKQGTRARYTVNGSKRSLIDERIAQLEKDATNPVHKGFSSLSRFLPVGLKAAAPAWLRPASVPVSVPWQELY